MPHTNFVWNQCISMVYDFKIEADPSGSTSRIDNHRGDIMSRMRLQLKYLNGVLQSNRIEVLRHHLNEQRLLQEYTIRTTLRTDVSQ
jgi:hypothetical protein